MTANSTRRDAPPLTYGIKLIRSAREAEAAWAHLGVSREGERYMTPKALFFCLEIEQLPCRAANVLKQEMLARGGEAAVNANTLYGRGTTGVLLMGTHRQYELLADKLTRQPFSSLQQVAQALTATLTALNTEPAGLNFPDGRSLDFQQTRIMGILNVTPDSFSDGGRYTDVDQAVARAWQMREEGADIIDIGAVSTRPGAALVTAAEEWARLAPLLKRLGREKDLLLSLDTFRAEVARQALDMGVAMINDIGGFMLDDELSAVVAAYQVPVVLMESRMPPHFADAAGQQKQAPRPYKNLLTDIAAALNGSITLALQNGVERRQIVIDPGAGFGKTPAENWQLIDRLAELKALGQPILLAVSRKRFIRQVLNERPEAGTESAVDEVSAAAGVAGILNGAQLLRVHDVARMKRAALAADAVRGSNNG
jgi:dihydropteroate synthase